MASEPTSGWTAPPIASFSGIDTSDTGSWAKDTARVPSTTPTGASTRESGRRTSSTEQEPSPLRMAPSTSGPSRTTGWSTGQSLRRMLPPSLCSLSLVVRKARLARRTPRGLEPRKRRQRRQETRPPPARPEERLPRELRLPLRVRAASVAPLRANLPPLEPRRRSRRTLSGS